MQVEFVKSFRAYRRGQTAQLGDGEANLLIARGIAVPQQQQQQLLETATAEPEARTATVRRRRRKRSEIPQPHD